jgi:hypothetical protein
MIWNTAHSNRKEETMPTNAVVRACIDERIKDEGTVVLAAMGF